MLPKRELRIGGIRIRHIFRKHKDQTQDSNSNSTRIIRKQKEKSPPAEPATKNEKSKLKSTVSKLPSADVPVKCQTCSETFAAKHELYAHEEKQHNYTRKFQCAGCDSKFDSSKKYDRRVRILSLLCKCSIAVGGNGRLT